MTSGRRLSTGIMAALATVLVAGGVALGASELSGDDTTASSTPSSQSSPATSPTETPTLTQSPTPSLTPTPTPTALMAAGTTGDQVRELQSRLKQIQWYAPDITGTYDPVTVEAVTGFQGKRDLPQTGEVDQPTWDALVAMTRTPTDDEMNNRIVAGPTILGPGDSGDKVRELQARLKQIGWFSGEITPNYGDSTSQSVAGFQTKRGFPATGEVDQRTWDKLAAMTRKPTSDEMYNRTPSNVGGLDSRCLTGRVLCIDKSTRSLRWVIDGDVRMTLDVRFGSELTPTREGEFEVYYKSRYHVSSLYNTDMPYAMFFSGGQAVHYSPDFAANGYNGSSHGCVNVRDEAAIASLFDQVGIGTTVIVYRS